MTGMAKAPDRWHRWLMDRRFGGDPAARAFYRVLRPGGRISVFEPINVLMRDPDRFLGATT